MDMSKRIEVLIQKIKHFIILNTGRPAEYASTEEFYQACATALREGIMANWTATLETVETKKSRILGYLSMEYLPGRLFGNNATNLGVVDLAKTIIAQLGLSYVDIAEFETDPGLGNGGLGRLASCFLDSLATLNFPARAYGLRYQYGIFEQEIWNGKQVERPDCWLLNEDPWEARRDMLSVTVHFRGKPIHALNQHGDEAYLLEDYESIRALPFDMPIVGYAQTPNYSVMHLRLWSTKESPRNFQLQKFNAGLLDQAAENTLLTDVLYPNDQSEVGKRVRLKQEFLLVSASLQDLIRRHRRIYGDLSSFASQTRIQINDTHPALVIAELMRTLIKNYDFSWKSAWETTQTCCSYTNHTILREALEEWNQLRMQDLLPRQFRVIQKLNQEFCDDVRRKFPNDEPRVRRMSILENGQVRMAHLAIYGSHKVNGVAKLHTEILKSSLFKDFYEMYPDRFINITNGVTQRRWLLHCNPKLAEFISKRIGTEWIIDFPQLAKLKAFAADPKSQQEFLEIKKGNKRALIDFLLQNNPIRNDKGKIIAQSASIDTNALFDLQIKRVHEYKRQLLNALHLIMLYQELRASPNTTRIPRIAIIGGKTAPGYERAKQIIRLICCIGRAVNHDLAINQHLRVIYIENYNVSKAEILIPAADLSEQISTAGWEASGTGNMKLAINGALTIGTDDGANVEMREAISDAWWPFRFGASAEENAQAQNYIPSDIPKAHPIVQKALDALRDNTFAQTAEEQDAFRQIYDSLVQKDRFFVLRDLMAYYETQKKVEDLYRQPLKWAETAIHNISSMGPFSTDESIRNYSKLVWGLEPCPPDLATLERVRVEYFMPAEPPAPQH